MMTVIKHKGNKEWRERRERLTKSWTKELGSRKAVEGQMRRGDMASNVEHYIFLSFLTGAKMFRAVDVFSLPESFPFAPIVSFIGSTISVKCYSNFFVHLS